MEVLSVETELECFISLIYYQFVLKICIFISELCGKSDWNHMFYIGFLFLWLKNDQKLMGKERFALLTISTSQSITEGSQVGNLSQEPGGNTEAEVIKECCLLTLLFWIWKVCFLIHWDHLSIGDNAHNGPSHINHQSNKSPTNLPTGQSNDDIFLLRFLLSRWTYFV